MIRNKLVSVALLCSLLTVTYANEIVDCRVLTSASSNCNPFGAKLIRAKEVTYDIDTKKLIVSKTLPLPKKEVMKIISIPEMIEHYIDVESSVRFKGNDSKVKDNLSIHRTLETTSVKQIEENITITTDDRSNKDKNLSQYSLSEEGMYTVISGDVFSKISEKFGFSTQTLLALNHLDKKSTLHIGQIIKIPLSQKIVDSIVDAEYIIEKGDTLLSIAHRFNIDTEMLVSFNHLKSYAMIREGKTLSLPLPYILKQLEVDKKRDLAKKEKEQKKKEKLALLKKKEDAKKKASRIKARISKRKLYVKNKRLGRHRLRVTATAYSSHRAQTDSTPFLAAWNNRLRPGMKIIAVSRDLLSRYGLRNGTKVRISGLRGYYRVRDKMNKRFRRRIDIYMGTNRRRALRWGRRSVVIYW